MDQFKIEQKSMCATADDIKKIANSIEVLESEVIVISEDIRHKIKGMSDIRKKLNIIREKLKKDVSNTENLGDTLQTIINEYFNTEKRIIGFGEEGLKDRKIGNGFYADIEGEGENFESSDNDKGLGLVYGILARVFPTRQERIEGQEVTKAQEEAQDIYMKSEINKLKKEKYTIERWKEASKEERKQILEEYIKDIADIMGIDKENIKVEYDIETAIREEYKRNGNMNEEEIMKEVNSLIEEKDKLKGFTCNSGVIYISPELLNDDFVEWDTRTTESAFKTATHEVRHIYQSEVMKAADQSEDYPYIVSKSRIEEWKEGAKTYQRGDEEKYRWNELEIDSRGFADQYSWE